MRKMLSITLTLLVCLSLVTGCGNKKTDNKGDNDSNVVINTNEDVIKNQNIEGIEITDVSLIYDGGLSYLKATVTNNTGSDYSLNEYRINVKDSDGNIIVTIPGYVGSIIKDGESKNISSVVTENLSNASSIEYEVIR